MKKTLLTATAVTMITGIATVTAEASDYTVKKGDTLWAIAKENGTSVAELKKLNELTGDIIKVGDKIKVQSKDFYIVKKNDTLKGIAKAFEVKVADLKKWNNLSSDTLKEGKKLIVSQKGFDKVQSEKAKAPAAVAMTRVAAPVAAPTEEAAAETAETAEVTSNTATQLTTYETAQQDAAPAQATYETQYADYNQAASTPAYSGTASTPVSGDVASVANGMAAGKSYVYGANSASAVDCSAFAQQVMASMGKSIPRTTYAQMAAGTQVSDPQPGDLVFFNGGSHVGVYVGNGQMVDALNPSEGIKQRDVSYVSGSVTGYYRY